MDIVVQNNPFASNQTNLRQKEWNMDIFVGTTAILTNPSAFDNQHSNAKGNIALSFPPRPFFKAIDQRLPMFVVTNKLSGDNDDDVSFLYDDPDVDDDQCLPEITIDVLHIVFDGVEDFDEDEYDSDEYDSDDDEDDE
jgi:hypothetical protein